MKKPSQPNPSPRGRKGESNPEDAGAEESSDDEPSGDPNHSLQNDSRTRNAFLAEDGGVDFDDPNLSALFAETGVEERLDELGLE